MVNVLHIVCSLLIFALAYYIIAYIILVKNSSTELVSKLTPLNKKLLVYNSDQVAKSLLGSAGSTVMAFVKLNESDRTSTYTNQYTPLIQVENNWYFEIAPSKTDQKHSSTRLRVTTNRNGSLGDEIMDLPDLVRQKWIMVAILRDGRRFDVLYDNKIVMSHRLTNYPVVISSPLSVGHPYLNGSIIHVIAANRRLSPIEVEGERVKHVDTNNTVLEANQIDLVFPSISLLAQCPPGFPCDPITKPVNPKMKWDSPYA